MQARTVRDGGNAVALGLDDGVDGGHCYVNGLVREKSLAHVVDNAFRNQRTHSVVKDKVDVLRSALIGADGREAGVVAFLSAFKDLLYLFPAIAEHNVLHVAHVDGIAYNGNLVDVRIALKSVEGVFNDHLAGYLEELFGRAKTQTAAYAAG